MILTALGWLAGILLAALALHRVYQAARRGKHWTDPGNWIYALLFGGAAVADFTALGILSPLAGGLTAGIMIVIWLAAAKPWGKSGVFHLRAGVVTATGELAGDAGGIWRWITARFGREEDSGAGRSAEAAVAAVGGARVIPPVREDPALGTPPEPAAFAAIPAPPPYLELARYIHDFEPGDDQDLRMFMEGSASGGLLVSEAWRTFADTCLNGARLHPAYVAGVLEVGDTESESAGHKAQVHKRFGVIYGSVKEWIASHGPLPKPPDFLTGED